MVRIIIYSSQQILARGLESVIDSDPALELTVSCAELAALRLHLANDDADLAVLDVAPDITLAMLHELQNSAPRCKLILWTENIASDFALEALTIGIRGVLRKTLSAEAHLRCLHIVHEGELWLEKSLTDGFRDVRRVKLTLRESQLVSTLVRGLTNKEISYELGITVGTVKVYLSHLFHKSGVKDRFELALQGITNLSMAGISKDHGRLRSMVIEPACR